MNVDSQSEFGVLYFLDENPAFQKMARMSIQSLKRFHPDWPVRVITIPSAHVPLWKKIYRFVSFWKRGKRLARAGQDQRIVASKAEIMVNTPFRHTLYLDVDTIIMSPLNELREEALKCDVLITPMHWKSYARREEWQPPSWPYTMAGVMFFNDRFVSVYKKYIELLNEDISNLPTTDQFLVSLTCHLEPENLKISYRPDFQLDVLNLSNHLGEEDYPKVGECVDLTHDGLKNFYVFHYNEYKPQYMDQISKVWGITGDETP
jgi:hypothetical protein